MTVLLNVGGGFFDNNIIDILCYLVFFFVVPLGAPITIILTYPMYLINKVRKVSFALLILLGVFILEIFLYYTLASQNDYERLLLNFLVGVVLWSIFFLKRLLNERKATN
ncbi:hypothetical protein GCM10009118_14280 [Wandonia haliotis]|uniref:Uncharacterized protein n=1 Tax=Wandonia haliotis TaxID=574963 RepID=A0ABN1MQ79_9FLAO